ncbi:MAG: glutamate-5-semialdehyde dehydrogenase [Bacteroidia bacterium]|nr:glutamate-5-semialdehyde dehydrogenase [Bacteroidia bacterium]
MNANTNSSILPQLEAVKRASRAIRMMSDRGRQQLLITLAELVASHETEILLENEKDLMRMDDGDPRKDRLRLTPERIGSLVQSTREVAALSDPTGHILSDQVLENGLRIQKTTTALGVVGVIFESRPNVTLDVAALCLRSGNAVVLRGGSDAASSNACLVGIIHKALRAHEINPDCVQLLPTDRELVHAMLTADAYIDILIPRGSQALIDFVRKHATVPTIETGAGVCHTYVSTAADLTKAAAIVVNAKVSRPSVCNALDTVLVDAAVAEAFLPLILQDFHAYSVEVFADKTAYDILQAQGYSDVQQAREEDFGREFLSYKCSIKVVQNMEEALTHIAAYSSKHSEAIISEDADQCERFLQEVDAAAVYANASTRFTDGGVFGLGAEIGISTQKLHARGPFALEKLSTEKWVVRGDGQVR